MKAYLATSLIFHFGVLVCFAWTESTPQSEKMSSIQINFEVLSPQITAGLKSKSSVPKMNSPNQDSLSVRKVVRAESPTRRAQIKKIDVRQQVTPKDSVDDAGVAKAQNSQLHQNGDATQSGEQKVNYAQELKLYIEKNKFYPRSARRLKQAGLVLLHLQIDSEGHFHHIHILEPCNHETLNQAALDLIKKLGRFKPLPKEFANLTDFTIPIAYQLSGSPI